ncbi:MAG: hypothetical protein PUE81_00700 [Lachnospiraceae bacterium]|nr:hypothetical protein [Lachnospiraceae bacterium]MDY5103326.1 hypothetical protein [Agathobacter sp.]
MKLIACHIDNFGKLSQLDLEFGQGLNVIHEANAWGKSTLAAFLRVMFYGFDSKRESGAFDKERVVYRPWQGGVYGGEVDFEHCGKRYRVSRTFGKTEKTDEFHLYDLNTNLECHDFSSDIGSELFGLDSSSFKRSAFIAQNDCECGSTDAINAKLGNLAENTNDINNFESALKRIHDRMNKLSPDRATGSIKKRTNTITLLTEELRSFEAAEKSAGELAEKLSEKQGQRKELMEIRSQYASALQLASEESRRESLRANYDGILREVEDRKKALEQYQMLFPKRVPEESEFQEKNQEVQMLGVLKTTLYNIGLTDTEKAQYEKLKDMFSQGVPEAETLDEIDDKLDKLARYKDERAQLETKMSYFEAMAMKQEEVSTVVSRHMGALVMGILCVLAGIAGGVAFLLAPALAQYWMIGLILGIGVTFVGAALLIARTMRMRKEEKAIQLAIAKSEEEKRKLKEPVDEIQSLLSQVGTQMEQLRREVSAFLEQYRLYCDVDEARARIYELRSQIHEYDRLQNRMEKSDAAREDCDRTRQSLMAFGQDTGIDFGEDIALSISHMQTRAAEYRLAKSAYEAALDKKKSFEEEHPVEELTSTDKCPYSLDELNAMIWDVDQRIEDVRESIEQYNHQMEDLQEQLDLRDEKEQQLAICRNEQEQEGHQYEILTLTQNYLQSAKEQFSARYLGPIEQGFQKYYEMLTGDISGDWMVNANIAVQVKEQGELRETKWLSAGYQDLLGICMRLALVDAMYPQEKPFLVLDDPYVNLDEEKVQCGNRLLTQISQEYQVIYFTCHKSRMAES